MRSKIVLVLVLPCAALASLTACATDGGTTQREPRTPAPTITRAPATAVVSPSASAATQPATAVPTPATTPVPPACAPPYPTAASHAFCVDPALYEAATLDDVIDGDTIDVFIGATAERVRLFGIDAPERGDRCARESTARVSDLVAGGVRLRPDARKQDSYGRLLRYVYTTEGLSVDAVLIAEGLAFAWTRDGALRDDLMAIEAEARAAGRGCLW